MELTVIVPFYNGQKFIQKLLDSIPTEYPVIIVDDHSDEPLEHSDFQAKEGSRVYIRKDKQKGFFTGAVNYGISLCETDVLILNQDTSFSGGGWLHMIRKLSDGYGLIGERIAGDHPAWAGGYIHGTFMYIRRDVIESVGLMDQEFYPLWGSTCDYQLRSARKGFKALALHSIPDFHHERGERSYGEAIQSLLDREPEQKSLMIQTPPAISVVINAYNHGRFLPDAIHSLIGGPTCLGDHPGQTFQGFEVIVVDDGSTDNTREIMSAYADPALGVHYIHQLNQGSAVAMNTGIEFAHGRVIAVMDSDDMMSAERLEIMYKTLLEHPEKVIYDDLFLFNEDGFIKTPAGDFKVFRLPSYDFTKIMHKNTMHKGLMYRKKAWAEAGGYPSVMNKGREDWAFNVALGIKGWCGFHLSSPGYMYRRHETNRTHWNTSPAHRESFLIQLKQLFPNIYKGEFPMGCCGGSKRNTGVNTMNAQTEALIGSQGMILVQFNLNQPATSTWFGDVTKTPYKFGGQSVQGYVDVRDWPKFDGDWQGTQKVFSLVQEPEPEPEAAEPVSMGLADSVVAEAMGSMASIGSEATVNPSGTLKAKVITAVQPDAEPEVTPEVEPGDYLLWPEFDPGEFSVKALREKLAKENYDRGQLSTILWTEERGQNRISAVKAIEKALANA